MRRRFTRSHCEWIELRRSIDSLRPIEQTFNGQNLDAGIIFVVPEFGTVPTGVCRFGAHLFGWFLKRDQNSAGCFLVFHIAKQCRHITAINPAAFDLDNDFLAVNWFVTDGGRVFFNAVEQIFLSVS